MRRRIHDYPILSDTGSKVHSPYECGDRIILKLLGRFSRAVKLRVDFSWWNDRHAAGPKDIKRCQSIEQVDISLQQDDVLVLDEIPTRSIDHILCKSMDHGCLFRVHGDLDDRAPNVYSRSCGSPACFPCLSTHLF